MAGRRPDDKLRADQRADHPDGQILGPEMDPGRADGQGHVEPVIDHTGRLVRLAQPDHTVGEHVHVPIAQFLRPYLDDVHARVEGSRDRDERVTPEPCIRYQMKTAKQARSPFAGMTRIRFDGRALAALLSAR